jgi:DNA end-binding protein Ku
MRLIRGVSMPFVAIPPSVTFASHMFRLNVARARFCFNFRPAREISILTATMAQAHLGMPDVMRRRNWSGPCPFSPSSDR